MDLLFADKPAGATTHTSHAARPAAAAVNAAAKTLPPATVRDVNDGFAEHLGARLGEKLFVVHRLDRGTTGAICFARSAATAELLREAFEKHLVKKRYLFLTDRLGGPASFQVESFIERQGNSIVSEPGTSTRPANARTTLKKLDESDGFALWEALPETGKPHQIRLHAQSSGIPILGDGDHGGTLFSALCLHSEHLIFKLGDEDFMFASPPPRWFLKRSLLKDPLVAHWLVSIDRRERLLRSWFAGDTAPDGAALLARAGGSKDRTLRWIHSEGDPLRAEQLGPVFSLQWFSHRPPTPVEFAAVERLCAEVGWEQWQLKVRRDRGSTAGKATPDETHMSAQAPAAQWTAKENEITYEFRADQSLSPGLFLDQRRNRVWVRGHARGKSVLNLFCYTAGFSVAAASGGAAKVVSVDLSKQFLEWGKKNFALNGLTLEGHEFRAMDSREYLAWAKKKNISFDLVICDPPSFSRSDAGVFKIDQDLPELLAQLLAVTAPGGRVLFATNYESWTDEQLETKLRAILAAPTKFASDSARARVQLEATPSPDWDFELPGEPRNMKSVFLVS